MSQEEGNQLSEFQAMTSKRVNVSTANGYKAKLRQMVRWLEGDIGAGAVVADDTGMPTLPLDSERAMRFFAAYVEPRIDTHSIFGKPHKQVRSLKTQLSVLMVEKLPARCLERRPYWQRFSPSA